MKISDLVEDFERDTSIELVSALLEAAESIYVKKLSLNDWQWASNRDAHQAGPYIPQADRDSGFFPELKPKLREAGKAAILEANFDIHWLEADETREARLVNFRSKGEETHLTRVCKAEFSELNPASFLLIARRHNGSYQGITVDSHSAASSYLSDLLGLQVGFLSGIFQPAKVIKTQQDRLFEFIGEAVSAYRAGKLMEFAASHSVLPTPEDFAQTARNRYKDMHRIKDFDPFKLERPGDVVMEISRGVEYELYKELEVRQRSLELATLLLGADGKEVSLEQVLINLINDYPKVDRVLLSASQTRKSRAGTSFEKHIQRLLIDGNIPHVIQAVTTAKKRPDFILPDLKTFKSESRHKDAALVLSAKTTLRERWKQVFGEKQNCELYLATVDDSIAINAIDDMKAQGIILVVPESLKDSNTTAYKSQNNVITFKEFFENEVRKRRFGYW